MRRSERARAALLAAAPRTWLLLGFLHLAAAAILGAAAATGAPIAPPQAHVLVGTSGAFLIAGGLAYGFASPFLKRELVAPLAHLVPLALLVAFEGAGLALHAFGQNGLPAFRFGTAIAFFLLPLHLAVTAAFGPLWRGGVALFAKDQPYRRGDALAAALFGLGLAGFFAASILLLAPPRGSIGPGVAIALLLGALPFFAGVLAFLLPRNAKSPLRGVTLVAAAMLFQTLATAGLAFALARPLNADVRTPPALLALAFAFFAIALTRLRVEKPGPQLARARPFLRASFALAILAAAATLLATLGGAINDLLPVALYLHMLLAATLATACTLLGAPILLNAIPREGRWAPWSAALAILGMFLLAPSFQYDRPAFPGAAIIAVAAMLLLWGLAPMRNPRRDCPP